MIQEHWQKVYSTKEDHQVSWTQDYPKTAIDYIESLKLPKSANIIDVGGGSSNFVDALLDLDYQNITVLDISEAALAKSQKRLGERSFKINWVISDISEFKPTALFDFWYDRAVFHFLTDSDQIDQYVNNISKIISPSGHFLLGTFSENGPAKCSGLKVSQYSAQKMKDLFKKSFKVRKCFSETHTTPFDTQQEFQFCGFEKL